MYGVVFGRVENVVHKPAVTYPGVDGRPGNTVPEHMQVNLRVSKDVEKPYSFPLKFAMNDERLKLCIVDNTVKASFVASIQEAAKGAVWLRPGMDALKLEAVKA